MFNATNVLIFKEGDRLLGSPKTTWSLSADYSFPIGGSGLEGRLSGGASYHSEISRRALAGTPPVSTVLLGDDFLITRASFALSSSKGWEATLFVDKLGGAYPWVYGEGFVDLLGDHRLVTGVLSFGSRHVSHASPQHAHQDTAPVKWADAWIETKLSPEELAEAGVRIGTRMVVSRERKRALRMKDHIASYTLDNKASVAVLLELAARVKNPKADVFLVASSKEEVGAMGALYFAQREQVDALITLEICPIAPEYGIQDGPNPVLLAEDGRGIYDEEVIQLSRGNT